jgi:hypothetical protein
LAFPPPPKPKSHAILNGKHGFINEKGETTIPFEYDMAGNFNQGFVNVKKRQPLGTLEQRR